MNRRFLSLSIIVALVSACSSNNAQQANGSFAYTKQKTKEQLIIPQGLKRPAKKEIFAIPAITSAGPVGANVDIRSPSLVLPVATSTRIEPTSKEAIVWFDQLLDDTALVDLIETSIKEQLANDGVEFIPVAGQPHQSVSGWYTQEKETGFWLLSKVTQRESVKFSYILDVKPHGRSVSLKVVATDYMFSNEDTATVKMDEITQHRAEINMLNKIIGQVEYNYKLAQHEERLRRSNEKLVAVATNSKAEPALVLELELDTVWTDLLTFFSKNGFIVTDVNETKKVYHVSFKQQDISLWDRIWGDPEPVIVLPGENYQFKLNADERKTILTIYDEKDQAVSSELLTPMLPIFEKGLSFDDL